MDDLKHHEEMEMFLLERMRRAKLLDPLIFGGGTMLRLCFDLPRYSVDLDFYLRKSPEAFQSGAKQFTQFLQTLGGTLTDRWEKRSTWLWELRLPDYPRKLKIEVRKSTVEASHTELAIAHSSSSPFQVRLRVVTPGQMWQNKIAALLDRRQIRDAYDLEFLSLRKVGAFEKLDAKTLEGLLDRLKAFTEQDFKSILGGVLDKGEKQRVLEGRFSYLRMQITAALETQLQKL